MGRLWLGHIVLATVDDVISFACRIKVELFQSKPKSLTSNTANLKHKDTSQQ